MILKVYRIAAFSNLFFLFWIAVIVGTYSKIWGVMANTGHVLYILGFSSSLGVLTVGMIWGYASLKSFIWEALSSFPEENTRKYATIGLRSILLIWMVSFVFAGFIATRQPDFIREFVESEHLRAMISILGLVFGIIPPAEMIGNINLGSLWNEIVLVILIAPSYIVTIYFTPSITKWLEEIHCNHFGASFENFKKKDQIGIFSILFVALDVFSMTMLIGFVMISMPKIVL